MGKNTSISLGRHFARFIKKQVAGGRFGTASEVVRAALRCFEEEETKLAMLRAALVEGELSGFAEDYSIDDVIAEVKADRSERARNEPEPPQVKSRRAARR